jgi:hypothetical protein
VLKKQVSYLFLPHLTDRISELFFYLLVSLVRAAPLAEFLELYLALHELLVLAGPVVYSLAISTRDFYELFLSHSHDTLHYEHIKRNPAQNTPLTF